MTVSSKGIVISKENFGEADQYVQFLTQRWGMITVLAKSARKSKRRYVGGLDLFCHDELFIRGEPREHAYLQELAVLNSFTGIRDDLEKMLVAGKITQWIRKLTNVATPVPYIYSLLGQTLSLIEKEDRPDRFDLLVLLFKLKLLAFLGLKPQTRQCVKCDQVIDQKSLLDISAGGVVCPACLKAISLSEDLFLMQDEKIFLEQGEHFKLTHWQQLQLESHYTRHLSNVLTQFAMFHTHTRLPV